MNILDRFVLALVIIAAAVVIYRWVNQALLARNKDRVRGLDRFQRGTPGILYFTSPDCTPCITIQRPELARVKTELAESVQIITIDCQQEPQLASYWGVLSVPTTFLIDSGGRPRGVNHGVTRAVKLIKQIQTISDPATRQGPITANSPQ
jgi:thioredoxin 1